DVGGIDAGHKLSLLSSIAFGTKVDFDSVYLEGINRIKIEDIHHAAEMGYRIKLLGTAKMTTDGLSQSMAPCLVPANSPLGQLDGGTNMIVVEGDSVGQIVLRGAGAGEGPTASAVMGDVCDIARGFRISTFGQPASSLSQARSTMSTAATPYYIRMDLHDMPGALAAVASALGDAGVSIDRMSQSRHDDNIAPVLIVTHACTWDALSQAVDSLPQTGFVNGQPVALRIEDV
ncbi:MAG: homoserine dehydrogenase, partial [Paracoccaceae bacterium]|nr:homoserine dehydrogenase [Paracoccaceae bacterium]